jgi:hypothetical protein
MSRAACGGAFQAGNFVDFDESVHAARTAELIAMILGKESSLAAHTNACFEVSESWQLGVIVSHYRGGFLELLGIKGENIQSDSNGIKVLNFPAYNS